MWPDETESLEDTAPGDPLSGGGGGGGSYYYLDEGRAGGVSERSSTPVSVLALANDEEGRGPSAASESKPPQGDGGSAEDGTMGSDGGLREEWESMTTDEKVNRVCVAQEGVVSILRFFDLVHC